MTLKELRGRYPNWTFTDEGHRYSAVMPHWGALYGQDLDELADRMAQWAREHEEFQAAYPSVEDGPR